MTIEPTEPLDKSSEFAIDLANTIPAGTVEAVLAENFPSLADHPASPEMFRAGYAAGARDAYEQLEPRVAQMGKVMRNLYRMLDKSIADTDDVEYLVTLHSLRSELVGYLVSESDSIMAHARRKMAKMTGVLEEHIDDTVRVGDIPPTILEDLGRRMAQVDPSKFAVFAVTDGEKDAKGQGITLEVLQQRVAEGMPIPSMPPEHILKAQLVRYGAQQVRAARTMYRNLVNSLQSYRDTHEIDAKKTTDGVLSRMRGA